MKNLIGYLTIIKIILLVQSLVYAGPKLQLTASKSAKAGNINVAKDERVSIQVAAEPGSTIAIFCVPKLTYITPSNKSEVTFYASQSVTFMIAAFKDGDVTKQEMTVVVGNGPGPGPKPPNPPDPVIPVPTSKLGKAAYDLGTQVKSTTRLNDVKTAIAELSKFRPQVAAGAVTDPKAIAAGLVTAMIVPLPPDARKEWAKSLATILAPALADVIKDKVTGLQAIDEIVEGLKAVK